MYHYQFISNLINQAMLIINSSRPKTLVISFKAFRFTQTLKWCMLNISNQFENFKRKVLITTFKSFKFFDCARRELNIPHNKNYLEINSFNSSMEKVTSFPLATSSIDLFSFSKKSSLLLSSGIRSFFFFNCNSDIRIGAFYQSQNFIKKALH